MMLVEGVVVFVLLLVEVTVLELVQVAVGLNVGVTERLGLFVVDAVVEGVMVKDGVWLIDPERDGVTEEDTVRETVGEGVCEAVILGVTDMEAVVVADPVALLVCDCEGVGLGERLMQAVPKTMPLPAE